MLKINNATYATAFKAQLQSSKYGIAQAIQRRLNHTLNFDMKLPNGHNYVQPTGLFINNEFVKPLSKSKPSIPVYNPYNESLICDIYEGGADDVEKAIDAAEKAFQTWKLTTPEERSKLLYKLADLIEQNIDLLASIETLDNGKALSSAKGDVTLMANYFRYGASMCDKLHGTIFQNNKKDGFGYTVREPVGVCGLISSFNFPLMFVSWKLVPALVTGNTCVFKPSEHSCLSTLYFANLVKEAGFPPGVINFITGLGPVGATLTSSPKIKKISFTGSVGTAKKIMSSVGIKKVTLELGGKSPSIVTNKAKEDLDKVVDNICLGIFFNSGEVCCAGSRVYVQEDIYDELVEKLVKKTESLKVGDGFTDPYFGPLTNKMQLDKVKNYVDIATKEGAKLLTGGKQIGDKGYLFQPTIFGDCTNDMRVVKEEIFGPVLSLIKFKDVKEAIAMANDTEYGLAAGVFTSDLNEAIEISNQLNAGTVWVNTYNNFHPSLPFGGHSASGYGSEMSEEAFHCYTNVKAVKMNIKPIA
ncbi:related to Potassium-activated aldehyde dehydrogenase, mitochondrial [Hanseniaspora guilliermondii]|uniref:Related to Potassium-activated aldehyde dehydrogenase, mitochondrial n=1 Tax=Hanseniaspora guilliermondii TaxID=56406 RepID=A0A1L0B0G3_9ASCO|nr:related to Potassium-activated aldehyde dehydrogenase, mitochondrial [Hanseniaspora guilliermondii]